MRYIPSNWFADIFLVGFLTSNNWTNNSSKIWQKRDPPVTEVMLHNQIHDKQSNVKENTVLRFLSIRNAMKK